MRKSSGRPPTRRGLMFRRFLAVLLLGFAGNALAAQQAAVAQPLDSGTVVRLGWRGGPKQIGRLVAPLTPESDTVVYCHYPAPLCAQGLPIVRRSGLYASS